MSLANDLRMGWRYATGLVPFLRRPPAPEDPVADIRAQLARREDNLIETLHGGVFTNPRSPYRALFAYAGLGEPDVAALIRREGVDAALGTLYAAGVYITLDEFKGRVPIARPGLELPVQTASFDNPTLRGHLEGVTGGSRTQGTRLVLDLDDLEGECAAGVLWLQAHDALETPEIFWRVAAPAVSALKWVLVWSRQGIPIRRWYTQTRPGPRRPGGIKGLVIHSVTCALTALAGHPTPYPRYVPFNRPEPIARWLAEQTRRGQPHIVDTIVSSAVELCLAARRLGLDIHGHMFRTFSEPLTPAKAAVMYEAGCDVFSAYGMSEVGRLGDSCGTPNALDDMHLMTHRCAFLQIAKEVPGWPQPVGALYLTTLRPTAPKVMLNVETGDYGIMSERACGCPLGKAGLTTHLHTIRNYEKLTSTGMHFMGADLLDLLEVALPNRFGGAPTDYQFVEAEEDAHTVLKLVVSPRLGELDAAEIKTYVLRELEHRTAGGRLMTDIWRASDTLQIERALPYTTSSAKVQPLHVMPSQLRPSR
ncbi:MAG: hypothetical protein ABFD20_00970 [Anaerolineales bacterium]